jgi:hypothetical protein
LSYKLHTNFLSDEEINIISSESFLLFKDPETKYQTNLTRWDKNIILDSNIVLINNITNNLKLKTVDILNRNLKKLNKNKPDGISFFYWTKGSYIPWHSDEGYEMACTLYLNQNWDPNWGGFINIKTDEYNVSSIKPEYNNLVELQKNVFHSTTPTSLLADIRVTIQIFWNVSN